MEFASTRKRVRSVALISLVDVMFFILFFFMFSTSFTQEDSMALSLPGTGKEATKAPDTLRVFVSAEGALLVDGQRIEKDKLKELLKERLKNNAEARAVLYASEGVSVADSVSVLDIFSALGIKNASMARWQASPAPMPAYNPGGR